MLPSRSDRTAPLAWCTDSTTAKVDIQAQSMAPEGSANRYWDYSMDSIACVWMYICKEELARKQSNAGMGPRSQLGCARSRANSETSVVWVAACPS